MPYPMFYASGKGAVKMNDSEARRRELLQRTRKLYDDGRSVPAIHPRYGNLYRELYEEESPYPENTFFYRLTLGILCFICFVWMESSETKIANVSSMQIVTQIEKQMTLEEVQEVWKNL